MTERWRQIGYYVDAWVSDLGNVKELRDGKWVTLRQRDARGYLRVQLRRPDRKGRRKVLVHLLVLEAFVGPRPAGKEACHLSPDSHDNRLKMLKWGTHEENEAHKLIHGTAVRTGKRLDPSERMEVRRLRASDPKRYTQEVLAKMFGVGWRAILNLLNGNTYKEDLVPAF